MANARSTVMINLGCDDNDADLTGIAGELAEGLGADLIGAAAYELAVDVGTAIAGCGGLSSPQELFEREIANAKARIAEAKARFMEGVAGKAETVLWHSIVTAKSATEWLAKMARCADLVVTHPFADGSYASMFRRVNVGDLIMTVGRPELIVPRGVKTLNLDTALVAWRDTRESRVAISAALPLLALAKQVVVAEVAPVAALKDAEESVADVVAWLGRHGMNAEGRVQAAGASDIQALHGLIDDTGCGLMVAGAYGHSRMREWVLGGVTRDFLLRPRCPTLIAH